MPLLTNYRKFSALPMPGRVPVHRFPVQPQAGPARLARLFGAAGIGTPARAARMFAPLGMVEFMPHGEFFYNGDMPDDWSFTLPVIEHGGFGVAVVGDDDERAEFTIKADGTVNIIWSSANVVANANTDTMFCIGTAVASPCEIKNRLGALYGAMVRLWYN